MNGSIKEEMLVKDLINILHNKNPNYKICINHNNAICFQLFKDEVDEADKYIILG